MFPHSKPALVKDTASKSESGNGGNRQIRSSTQKNQISQLGPQTLAQWLRQMEICPECLELVARTPQEVSEYQNIITLWRESGRPDPATWLEPALAHRLRFRCSCPD